MLLALLILLLTDHLLMTANLIVASLDVAGPKVAQATLIVQMANVGMTRTPPRQVARPKCLGRKTATLSEPASPNVPKAWVQGRKKTSPYHSAMAPVLSRWTMRRYLGSGVVVWRSVLIHAWPDCLRELWPSSFVFQAGWANSRHGQTFEA